MNCETMKVRDKLTARNIVFIAAVGLVAIVMILGISLGNYREAVINLYRFETESSSRNIYNFIKRDVYLSGQMVTLWDSLPAIQVLGDTLLVRFSELDAIRYYLDEEERLFREDAFIADNVIQFGVDSIAHGFKVTMMLAATETSRIVNSGDRYHRSYKWTVVPREFYERRR